MFWVSKAQLELLEASRGEVESYLVLERYLGYIVIGNAHEELFLRIYEAPIDAHIYSELTPVLYHRRSEIIMGQSAWTTARPVERLLTRSLRTL